MIQENLGVSLGTCNFLEIFAVTTWVVSPKLQVLIVVSFVRVPQLNFIFCSVFPSFQFFLFSVNSQFCKNSGPTNWFLFFTTFFWEKWSRLFAPTKSLVKNRHMLTKRSSPKKVNLTLLCTEKIALFFRIFFDLPLFVAILFAKAIADNVRTKELLSKWRFYKFSSTEFSKLWDQMGRKPFFVDFFF